MRTLTTSMGWKSRTAVVAVVILAAIFESTFCVVQTDTDTTETQLSLQSSTESSVETPDAFLASNCRHRVEHACVLQPATGGQCSLALHLQSDFARVDGNSDKLCNGCGGTCCQHFTENFFRLLSKYLARREALEQWAEHALLARFICAVHYDCCSVSLVRCSHQLSAAMCSVSPSPSIYFHT